MIKIHEVILKEPELVCFQCEKAYKLNRTLNGQKVPICSYQCAVKYIATIIKNEAYPDEKLLEMWNISLARKDLSILNKEKATLDISRFLGKANFIYIISQYMDRDKGQGQETQGQAGLSTHRDKNRDNTHLRGVLSSVPMSPDRLFGCPSVRSLSLFSNLIKLNKKLDNSNNGK